MKKRELAILCVDDEAEVREALLRDLAPFEEVFRLEEAGDAGEASDLLLKMNEEGQTLALIFCDHVMPGESGVDFLIRLARDPAFRLAKKVLFTGQAGHEDTIHAINRARLDHYVAKPWQKEDLHEATKRLLTDYVIESKINPLPYMATLDTSRLATEVGRADLINDSL